MRKGEIRILFFCYANIFLVILLFVSSSRVSGKLYVRSIEMQIVRAMLSFGNSRSDDYFVDVCLCVGGWVLWRQVYVLDYLQHHECCSRGRWRSCPPPPTSKYMSLRVYLSLSLSRAHALTHTHACFPFPLVDEWIIKATLFMIHADPSLSQLFLLVCRSRGRAQPRLSLSHCTAHILRGQNKRGTEC